MRGAQWASKVFLFCTVWLRKVSLIRQQLNQSNKKKWKRMLVRPEGRSQAERRAGAKALVQGLACCILRTLNDQYGHKGTRGRAGETT